MAEAEQNIVRQIAWKEIFPWWILVRCFRLAISPPVLLLMAVGITLTVLGWGGLGLLLSPDPAWRIGSQKGCPWLDVLTPVPERLGIEGCPLCPVLAPVTEPEIKNLGSSLGLNRGDLSGLRDLGEIPASGPAEAKAPAIPSETSVPLPEMPSGYLGAWFRPLATALTGSGRFQDWLYLMLACLWKLAVWAFFGGAVTRMAVVRLAAEERLPLVKAVQFAHQKWPSYFAAPVFPFLGIFLAGLPIAILGLFLRFGVGILIAGLLWPLALLAGLMIMVLLLGLVFGWPLMWATISTEGTDCFDALSRSYAYVFQRPLRYLFYAVVAGLLGLLGWMLVRQFAAGLIQMTYWCAGWGYGGDAAQLVAQTSSGPVANVGKLLIRFWVACVKLAAISYLLAYFWVAASAIYLLLRYDVDATEMDEVYLEEDQQPGYAMPPLKPDASVSGAAGAASGSPTPTTNTPGSEAGPGPEPSGPSTAPNPQE